MVEHINTWHGIQQKWEKGVVGPEERTPKGRTDRLLEEVEELKEAVVNIDGTLEKQLAAGYEAADVIIIALGVIDALGFDAERLINEKMDINFRKYSAHGNAQLRESGYDYVSARKEQKARWKKL